MFTLRRKLLNIDNIELTKKEIENVKIKYEKNLYNVDTNMIKFTIDDQTFLDILLAEMRENQTLPQLSGKRKCLKKKLNYTKAFSNQSKFNWAKVKYFLTLESRK